MTKILLIEDEMVMREEILEWLKLEGYEAFGAEDGMKGIDAAFRHLPDLIISDIMMPHLDGYGVLLEVHANPATMSIPFIFLTAKAAHEDIRKGMDLGADDYVTKPFTRLELLHAIQTRLARKAAQDQAHQHSLEHLQQAMVQEHEHRILKAKLVSMFSHDFANSLTSILMTNSLMRSYSDRMDETRRTAHLNRIESSTRRLLQMLDDLLVVAQMETGNLTVEPELLNVAHFIQRFQEDCQAIYADSHQIVFENHINNLIWIDTRLLRLILANLVASATKKSPRGATIRVTVDCTETECQLAVQDQSTTISEADQLRLFDMMRRDADTSNISATGLELAIVKQAVELHGASIDFAFKPNLGTTVIVNIPLPQGKH